MTTSGMAMTIENASHADSVNESDQSTTLQEHAGSNETPYVATGVDDPSHPYHLHSRVVADFEFGAVLGEGSFSTVLLGRDKKTGKQYAIKKLDKAHIVKNNKVKYVMIERDALSRMNHPGIVRLYWTFKDNLSLYYVLDLARNGELYTYLRRLAPFDVETARFYAAEILLAIDYIHQQGVIHRDIKPENILIDTDMHIKITDFGSAKIIRTQGSPTDTTQNEASTRSFVGTAEYVSPELLKSEPTQREVDYWAFGCVLFQMLSGRSPFKATSDYLIFQKIKNLDYAFPDHFPPVAKDLVQKLLVADPNERLGSDATGGIDAIKSHPFFDGIDWENLFATEAPPLKERLDAIKAKHSVVPEENGFDAWFGHEESENPFADKGNEEPTDDDDDDDDDDNIIVRYPMRESLTPVYASRRHSPSDTSEHQQTSSSHNSTLERLGEQSHPLHMPHLYPNESIVRCGRVIRRRGLFSKKRYLILTSQQRLLYLDDGPELDGSGGSLRCEIEWSSKLLPELKTKSVFAIRTPEKSYTFEDPKRNAQEWVNTINTMLVDSFGVTA